MAESTENSNDYLSFQELSLRADKGSRTIVLIRDGMKCVKCGATGVQVHEIVPRSHFGKSSLHICFHPKNRCLLCLRCHERAHSFKWRVKLLKLLKGKYGYEYTEKQFERYTKQD